MQLNSHPRHPHPHQYSRCMQRLYRNGFRTAVPILLMLCVCNACTDPLFHNDDLPVKVPSVSDVQANTVTGYMHPAQMDMENEDGPGQVWQVCKADPDLQVALDIKNSRMLFRAARSMEVLNIWDEPQQCHSGLVQTKTHQEYDFQVLEVQLKPDFLQCVSKNAHGIYYKIRLK